MVKYLPNAKNEKKYLCRFLESGDIPIDNNRAENAVRAFCGEVNMQKRQYVTADVFLRGKRDLFGGYGNSCEKIVKV